MLSDNQKVQQEIRMQKKILGIVTPANSDHTYRLQITSGDQPE